MYSSHGKEGKIGLVGNLFTAQGENGTLSQPLGVIVFYFIRSLFSVLGRFFYEGPKINEEFFLKQKKWPYTVYEKPEK